MRHFDAYKVLCVERSATKDEIRRAYKVQALKHHPDKKPEAERAEATEKFQLVAKAYSILWDEQQRLEHDAQLLAAEKHGRKHERSGAERRASKHERSGVEREGSTNSTGSDSGYSLGRARALFEEVFGEEVAGLIGKVGDAHLKVVSGLSRVVEATISSARETATRSSFVQQAVYSKFHDAADEASELVIEKLCEVQLRKQEREERLEDVRVHEKRCASAKRARRTRPGKLWRLINPAARQQQKEEDRAVEEDAVRTTQKLRRRVLEAEARWRAAWRELELAKHRAEEADREREAFLREGVTIGTAAQVVGSQLLGRLGIAQEKKKK